MASRILPRPLLFFLIVSIGLFFIQSFFPIPFITGIIQRVFSAPLAAVYSYKTFGATESSDVLQQIQNENKKLAQKMVEYSRLKKDNEALRSQYEESIVPTKKLLVGHVVGSIGSANAPNSLTIDVGRANHIQNGMNVLVDNQLVGRIKDVSENFSRVELVVSPTFSTVGKTSQNNAIGVIKGAGDFILFDNVSIKDKLEKGDILTTKGDVKNTGIGIYPELIVGKIRTVAKNENDTFQNAEIEPIVDYSKLTTVFVMIQ